MQVRYLSGTGDDYIAAVSDAQAGDAHAGGDAIGAARADDAPVGGDAVGAARAGDASESVDTAPEPQIKSDQNPIPAHPLIGLQSHEERMRAPIRYAAAAEKNENRCLRPKQRDATQNVLVYMQTPAFVEQQRQNKLLLALAKETRHRKKMLLLSGQN